MASAFLGTTVMADHAFEHARLLTLGVQERATIANDAHHFYRFDLDGSARVEVRSGGSEDVMGILFDGALNVLDEDDDGGTNLNFRMIAELSPGPHYVEVTLVDGAGDYSVIFRVLREGDDHGDAALSSSRLAPNIRTAGRIVPATDVDVFRIDIDAPVLATMGTSGPADTAGRLVDSDGNTIATEEYGGSGNNFSMVERLVPGVFYLHVTAAEQAAYGVQYSIPEDVPAQGPPPVEIGSMLGAWFGNNHFGGSFGWSSFADFYVLDRLVQSGGVTLAVENHFTFDGYLNDPDESFFVGSVVRDLGGSIALDYLVLERAFDIFCASYAFSLASPDHGSDGTLYLFGDVDEDTLECIFEDASVYEAVVVRAIAPDTGLLAAERTRDVAEARSRAMRNAVPVAYRPDILAAVQAALP